MTPDELNAWLWSRAQANRDTQRQTVRESQARQDATLANDSASRLQKEVGLGVQQAHSVAKAILEDAVAASTRPDGTIDVGRYQQEVRRLTDVAINQFLGKAK